MITPFSQSKDTYKIFFNIKYSQSEVFEELILENLLGITIYEVTSQTVDSQPNDIWCFEIYLSEKPNLAILTKQIIEFANQNHLDILSQIKSEKIEDQDWVAFYQNQLKPIEIGRFFISSRSQKELCPADKIGICIEASRAFGTGQHDTSAGCIEALEQLSYLQFNKIFDIGTGTGILALAAENLWPEAEIFACDIEEISIEIAKDNAEFNNSNIIFYTNSLQHLLPFDQLNIEFDLIFSNILASPLIELSEIIHKITKLNGYVILSGFLDYQLQSVLEAYEKVGFTLKNVNYKNKWVILIIQLADKKVEIEKGHIAPHFNTR